MSDPLQQQIEAAEGYEALLVPALFTRWTGPVLDAVAVAAGQRVLDVACGTGVLARAAHRRVAPDDAITGGTVTGVDPAPGMLAVARRLTESLAPPIDWRQGTAEALPVPDGAFDAAVSQFGMMFFPDRPAAAGELLRALAPGGRFAVAVWDSLENTPAYAAEVDLLDRLAGTAAGDAVRAPFALGDPDRLATLFEQAGAARVEVAAQRGAGRFPSVRTMVEADLRGWLPVMGVELDERLIERVLAEAERDLAPYVTADGAAEFEMSALIVSGARG